MAPFYFIEGEGRKLWGGEPKDPEQIRVEVVEETNSYVAGGDRMQVIFRETVVY